MWCQWLTALYLEMFIPHCNGGMRGSPVALHTTKRWSPLTDLTVLRKHHHVDKHNNASTSQETTEHHGGAVTQQSTQLVHLLTNLLANSVTKEITKLLAKSLNKWLPNLTANTVINLTDLVANSGTEFPKLLANSVTLSRSPNKPEFSQTFTYPPPTLCYPLFKALWLLQILPALSLPMSQKCAKIPSHITKMYLRSEVLCLSFSVNSNLWLPFYAYQARSIKEQFLPIRTIHKY